MSPEAIEAASVQLNWLIGGINTIVLLVSSLMMVLAVHSAQLGQQRAVYRFCLATAALGVLFLCFKGVEYYIDYLDNLIPGWKFDRQEWLVPKTPGSRPDGRPDRLRAAVSVVVLDHDRPARAARDRSASSPC